MGEIARTVTLEIPASVAYKAIKKHFARKWIRAYCSDLIKGMLVQDVIVDYRLSKDVPNSELVFIASNFGSKLEESFRILPIGEKNCEITYSLSYRFVSDSSAKAYFIQILGCLLMLELGYKSRNNAGQSNV